MNLKDPPAGVLGRGLPEGPHNEPAMAVSVDSLRADMPAGIRQFVTFMVAGEAFAVPMGPVQEIIRVPTVAQVPLCPPALLGLANLRGRILPIVSLRQLFGLAEGEREDANRALVFQGGQTLGFVVDRVSSVISVDSRQIEPASRIDGVIPVAFLSGVIQLPDAQGQVQLLQVLDLRHLAQAQLPGLVASSASPLHSPCEPTPDATSGSHEATDDQASASGAHDDDLRLVSFTVAGQEFAIDIADVQEIVQVPETVIGVPRSAAHVMGLVSLRQRLLPLVSLRSLFQLPPTPVDEHHRIVVITLPEGAQVGLVTDAVKEVLTVPRGQTDPMPPLLAADPQLREFEQLCRLDEGRRLISIITTAKLLGLTALRAAVQVARQASADAAMPIQDPNATVNTAGHIDNHINDHGDDSGDDHQLVIFRLGAEEFGVPIRSVQEIVRVPETLTRLPRTPAWVEGVINLRGAVLPVIDQRLRFGLAAGERHDRQRIMVYRLRGVLTGFIVDAVIDVLRISRTQMEAAPELAAQAGGLISQVAKLGSEGRLVLLVDPRQLLDDREASTLATLEPGA